jgi:hypothetical protein
VGLAACASGSGLPEGTRGAPPGEVTPAFQAMRSTLMEGLRLSEAGDGAGLRALNADITEIGMALLTSGLPHDVRRADVPRFLEGRAAFGDALKAWVTALEQPDDRIVGAALGDLVDAYWGWVDAYKGLPPERSV